MFGVSEALLLVLPLLRSPEPASARYWGETLEKAWFTGRPEWVEMTISILKGEAMLPDKAWWPSCRRLRDGRWLLARYDANGDGLVSRSELPLGEAEFARLDRDRDGELTPKDLDGGPGGRSSAAGTWFRALDSDTNGRISRKELEELFDAADQDKLGFLTPDDLQTFLSRDEPPPSSKEEDDDMPPPMALLQMLFSGQLGSLTEGPGAMELAPDFRLRTLDGKSEITLSSSRGKKPVVLVFGSFT